MAVLRLITNSNLVGCIDRQVGGLLALENPAGVDAGLAICVGNARSVAHQAAGFGRLTQGIDRRHPMVRRQRNELYARLLNNGPGPTTSASTGFCARVAKTVSMSRSVLALRTSICCLRAEAAAWTSETKDSVRGNLGLIEHGNARGSRQQLAQEPKLLCRQLGGDKGDTGDVAARPVEAGDETSL